MSEVRRCRECGLIQMGSPRKYCDSCGGPAVLLLEPDEIQGYWRDAYNRSRKWVYVWWVAWLVTAVIAIWEWGR